MIKNLVFDLGGVLIKIHLQGCIDAFRKLGFKDVDLFLNTVAQKGVFGDLEAGRASEEDFRREVSLHCGREVSLEECRQGWLGFIDGAITPNLLQLTKLRAEGYNLAVLSNTNSFVASWYHSKGFDGAGHSLNNYIPRKHQYLSYEQKTMKPGPEIYEKMLAGENFAPDETLFVDDNETNLKTARKLGMKTFLPENGELWGSRLEAYLN